MTDYDFVTDGCSGGLTRLWKKLRGIDPPWNDLCKEHDRDYWQGGTVEQRRESDRRLMSGVVDNGHPIWAFFMWCCVRVGGVPWLPTSWRWGYGYRWPRRFFYTKE